MMLTSISRAINTYLRLDPTSLSRLEKLDGKVVTIELLPINFIFQCEFTKNNIVIKQDAILPAETKICGTPLQMLNIVLMKNERHRFFADDVILEGDAEVAQLVISLFDELTIDWENYLSKWIGDVPVYHLSRTFQEMSAWIKKAETSCSQNINDYIHEELSCLPPREALQDFFSEIDTLRMDVDRMEARLNQIKMSLQCTDSEKKL